MTVFAQAEKKLSLGEHEIFKIAKAKHTILIDGKLQEKDWQNTEVRTLDYFYRIEQPQDEQQTKFRMLWDENNLYVFFECEDAYITAREKNRDGKPYLDDCAEIFLIPAPDSLNMHYGFEVNLHKASNDFIWLNNFYQGKSGMIKSYNPDFKVEVSVDGTVNNNSDIDKGWTMEMAIPLKHFKGVDNFFPVKNGSKWAFLAARQDRNDAIGDRRSTSTLFPIYNIEKSVHQPNRFGILQFVD
ncbi:MAG: carbohydrate-binding family 9-like protein [Bacteroidales bacterium]